MMGHWYDLLPILLLGILIFGAKRLPEMGASVGKTIREFQKSMREVTEGSDEPARVAPPRVDTPPILNAATSSESVNPNAAAEAVHGGVQTAKSESDA